MSRPAKPPSVAETPSARPQAPPQRGEAKRGGMKEASLMAEAPLRQAQDTASACLQAAEAPSPKQLRPGCKQARLQAPKRGGIERGVPSAELASGRLEGLVDSLFFIQDLLAQAIKSQAQGEALDILTLAELSRNFTHSALNITRTLQVKQALEAPKNEWSLILAELSLELEEEAL